MSVKHGEPEGRGAAWGEERRWRRRWRRATKERATREGGASKAPRRRAGKHSVRARIALACGGLFLVVGGALIAGTYELIGHLSGQGAAKTAYENQMAQFYRDCQANHEAGRAQDPDYAQKCRYAAQTAALYGADAQHASDRHWFLVFSLAGLGVTTILAGGLGWAVGGRVLRPLRVITEAARAASQENLDQRLALAGPPDELKELADTFDAMLARLDAAFASQRRFVANASHELRTPLTEMRALIDVTMAKPTRSAAHLESLVVGVRAAVDRSGRLIEALLTLARSDRGLATTEMVDLPTAVDDAVDLLGPAAAARQVTIDTALGDARASGDRVLLERLVTNLLDNAVRYNVPGGWVRATTERRAEGVRLVVANSGALIAADRVPELLEPFRRLNERPGAGTGSGLGLSIAASVANAHGGRLSARARPEGGLEVEVILPAAAGPQGRAGVAASVSARTA
jgi:signal transduction histidine kinase